MRGVGHVAQKEKKRNKCKILVEHLKESDHLKDLGVLESKMDLEVVGLKFIWVRIETSGRGL
jgi:hypothetical protein